jgi:hypothetical protein
VDVRIAQASRAQVLRTHQVRVRVTSPGAATVRLRGTGLRSRTLVLRRAGSRTVSLRVTSPLLARLRSCAGAQVSVRAVSVGRSRFAKLKFPSVCAQGKPPAPAAMPSAQPAGGTTGATGSVTPPGQAKREPTYFVGAASRSINPDPDGTFAGKTVYLGGYGIASPPADAGRPATGFLGDGIHVRAFAVSDGEHATAIADIEAQGWFVAQQDAPYGLLDMRKAVEEKTKGALKASSVIVQSDHSHGGIDGMGVWGGIPVEYRKFIFDQTVAAIVEAYEKRRAGTLYYGTAPGRDLLSNQFDYDDANKAMDSDVRVLQARDKAGKPFVTLLNFSAHATVLGSGNTKATGDWPQAANQLIAERLGGEPVTIVATLGRTQPADRGCHQAGLNGDAQSLCTLNDYAGRVVDRAEVALENAKPISGTPTVAGQSYLIQDVTSNPLLLGLLIGGGPIGAPLNRSLQPPWLTGNVLGTVAASQRIGDVLLSSFPGEAYPQIALKIAELAKGAKGFMTAGLANDQLGYLIAPYESYPEPIRRSFFNQEGDEVNPIDNDNYFFNVSHTMGERVTCAALRGAGELFGKGNEYRDGYDRCALFANDAALAPGSDVDGPAPAG